VTGARGATLVYAIVDPGARQLRFASAGHPPPLLVTAAGEPRYLEEARGVPLDRSLGFVYEDAVVTLPDFATLVLYSDGAIERRGEPLDAGMGRLADAAVAGARLEPDALCSALLETLIDDSRPLRDDVALLVARALPPLVAPLHLWFAARADQLAVVREAMRTWLASAGVETGDGELVVLAAGELCANSVEHAYPPGSDAAVEVALARELGGVLTLVVRDRGRWRPPPADPGDRGRGLGIVRALMHTVDVDPGGEGTTVSVRYRPGAAPPAPTGVIGPPMVAVEIVGGVPVAHLQGEIDRSNAGQVEPELLALAPGPVIVDLSRLAFLSSAGLAVLFGLAKQCARMIVVAPAGAAFRRTLEVAELSRVAQIVDSVELALEDCG
jgi:anti-anti-sigma factor